MKDLGGSKEFLGIFKETSIAYFFGLGGLLAGFMIAYQLDVFRLSPWAMALYPAIVSAKGVIGGLLSGRLGTALHLGIIKPSFFGNTKSFYRLLEAILVITLVTSILICAISLIFGQLFWGITIADFPAILSVVIATMSLGLLLSFVTIKVAFLSFKKGLDPDVIVYPIMSTIADIFITFCYILILSLFFFNEQGKLAISFIALIPILFICYILPKNLHEMEFVKTLKESMITMVFVALIVNITGTVLNGISTFVADRKEIFTVYPALIGMIGNVGSVVGSTATTKLALGLLTPSFSSIKQHSKNILSAWSASIIMFILFALLSLLIHGILSLSSFAWFTYVLLVANVIAVVAIIILSYSISILTFKRGLDPDNFVIPIESSFADSITSIALFAALLLVG